MRAKKPTVAELQKTLEEVRSESLLLGWYAARLIEGAKPDAVVNGKDLLEFTDNEYIALNTYQLFDSKRAHGGFVAVIHNDAPRSPSVRVMYLDKWTADIRTRPQSYGPEAIAAERLEIARNRIFDGMAQAWNETTQEPEGPQTEETTPHEPGAPAAQAWHYISEIEDKRAENLARLNLAADAYHCNIQNAAVKLAQEGNGELLYLAQYASGATLWTSADRQTSKMVPRIEVTD